MTLTAERLRHIARKLRTYAGIYDGDKEARAMVDDCEHAASMLEYAEFRKGMLEALRKAAEIGIYREGPMHFHPLPVSPGEAEKLEKELRDRGYKIVRDAA